MASGCGQNEAEPASDAKPTVEASAAATGVSAKISSISGPGGVTSPALPSGTFLGPGGRVEPGQELRTPKGTLAELELETGGRLYMNEDTALSLPGAEHPEAVSLERGELVVTAGKPSDPSIIVRSGEDTLTVDSGEVQVRAGGGRHRYAVVHGRASVLSAGQTIALGSGESIETPLPEAEPRPEPQLSLRPLEDTGWARTFDAAAAMADSVPRGVGSLTARRPGTRGEKQQLRLTDHQVTVNISGRIAHTEVEQAFFNGRGQVLEGIYRFPIPEDGSVSGLSLLVGNTWMVGEVVEKQRARNIFKQIVDATIPRDPALLEWERGNVFKLRVFPIPGNGQRKVRLSYTQVLPVVGGKLRYRYPMGGTGATGTPIDRFGFTVRIDGNELAPEQLENITTPMLALERRSDGDVVELHTEREAFLPTFDLGLDVPVPESEEQVHTRSYLDRDGQAYFMVAMQPEFDIAADERPVHYAFVLDRSHSTSPELWTTARGVVDAMTELMDEDDRFTILACDSACEEHADGLQAPTSEAVTRAQGFLDAQDLAGASDLVGSLQQARTALDRGSAAAQRVVVYLGDGVPTSGEMAPDGITDLLKTSLADTRVLAVALGARSDLTALQAVVDVTGGDLVQADARDDLRALVRELRLRAEVPALRNARLELPEGMVMARMQNVSAIRPGDTVVVTGKLRHRVRGDIVLHGQSSAGPVRVAVPVDLTASRTDASDVDAHLPRTWAKMQIQHLTQTQGYRAQKEIIALSQDYTVLSRHTALLVLENDAMYREFNVVRRAQNTDKWNGKLEDNDGAEQASGEGIRGAEAKPDKKPLGSGAAADEGAVAKNDPGTPGRLRSELLEKKEVEPDAQLRQRPPAGTLAPAAPATPPTSSAPAEPEPEPEPDFDVGGEKSLETDRGDSFYKDTPQPDPPADSLDDVLTEEEDNEAQAGREPLGTTGRGGGGSGPIGEVTPTKRNKRKAAKPQKKPSSANAPLDDDPLAGLGGSGKRSSSRSSRWGEGRGHRRWREPALKIRTSPTTSASSMARVEALAAAVERNPTERAAHGKLVRTALATGHHNLLGFAQAWAQVDPDHHRALESLADALARAGDPIALRAYESVVEVNPFSTRDHQALARAFENKGDMQRACSHHRAVVSIDPATVSHQAGLIACLQRAGRTPEARQTERAFVDAAEAGRGQRDRAAALSRSVSKHSIALPRSAQLRATLTWAGSDDLDIAIVDRKGRRLSSLHGQRGVRVLEGRGREELTLSRVSSAVFVEVTRIRAVGSSAETPTSPVSATLEIKTPGGRRTIPITIGTGSQRVAKVFWSR